MLIQKNLKKQKGFHVSKEEMVMKRQNINWILTPIDEHPPTKIECFLNIRPKAQLSQRYSKRNDEREINLMDLL